MPAYTNLLTFGTLDQSSEPTSFRVNLPAGALPDLSGTIPANITALVSALDTELVDWTAVTYTANQTRRLSTALVGESNREDKLELSYVDNTTFKRYTSEVPCRKGGLATESGSDLIPAATWSATKTAFEALVRSPEGNAVTLQAVRLIGRSS
jgi:hypothetical protein